MNFDEMAKKYQNDPHFHTVVNALYSMIYQGHLTVAELRSAAMFAGYKFESEKARPTFFGDKLKDF